MEQWTDRIQNALQYIEGHLLEEMDIREIAKRAYVSPFYFQRIFAALCGMSVGEYIRSRRLTLAGEELRSSGGKIIDIAAKYGYDSPDSFNRAFQRFHGISPSAARKNADGLHSCPPANIRQTKDHTGNIEYRIEEKPRLTMMGQFRKFNPETSYQEIPVYWDEMMSDADSPIVGMYGICMDTDESGKAFDYWIADSCSPGQTVPGGCAVITIPAGTWAVFPCKLKTLQETNTRMWQEWLPNSREYRLGGSYNIECYLPIGTADPGESDVELWLPVLKNQEES